MRRLSARHGMAHDRGAVIPIVALSLVTLIVMTAFSIDLGRQIMRRREAQAVADVVALDLSRQVNGRTVTAIQSDAQWSTTKSEAAARNNWPNSKLAAELGHLDSATGAFTVMTGAQIPDSVRVTATDVVNYYFASVVGINNGNVNRSAVATNNAKACLSLGSFAAALSRNPSSLLGGLLNGAFGSSLTLVSYQGIANAQINLGDIAAQMGFGTPTDFLTANVSQKEFILAEARALQASGGDPAAVAALNAFAATVPANATFNVGSLVSVEQGGEQAALSTAFNALDLLSGSVLLSDGSHAISLTAGVPGVTNVQATVIEKPQLGCGGIGGPPVQTSQIRITFDLSVSLLGLLGVASVHVQLDMASATGTLVAPLSCGPPALANVSVAGSLVTMSITQTILGIPLTVTPNAADVPSSVVSFTIPTDAYNVMKRSGSGSVGLAGTTVTGLGLNALVATTLGTVFGLLDSAIVKPLTEAVGLDVAGADVMILPTIDCDAIKLAL